MHNHLSETLLKEVFPSLPGWPKECNAYAYNGYEPDRVAQISRWNEFVYHLTMVLMKVDRASMYNSLEVRVPLLDREVIEVASRIDWRDCLNIDQKIGKFPLRRSLARYVKHQTDKKRGFEVPMATWLRTSLKGLFEELVLKRSDILGLEINRKALSKIFERHIRGESNYAWGLWPLLSLALWVDRHYNSAYEK
jgi:asparagine synthase (glutamine-hydrolysing)